MLEIPPRRVEPAPGHPPLSLQRVEKGDVPRGNTGRDHGVDGEHPVNHPPVDEGDGQTP
jgi:hypothetical protein